MTARDAPWRLLARATARLQQEITDHGCSHSDMNSVYIVDLRTALSDLSCASALDYQWQRAATNQGEESSGIAHAV